MSLDIALLVLRIAVAIALYAFLGVLLLFLWRDVRAIGRTTEEHWRQGRLVVVECEDVELQSGHEYHLRPHTTLGRAPTNTVVLPDSFASNEHALIVLREGKWWLHDQESRNGTTINEVPVTDAVVLSSGDIIGIGRVKLRLELS